ncbi:MAG TPA: R3H domain-containing nucleic acid-binding protein [Dongiaceae bacterium]|nr:R3H domain-containing nucleic acid-binding protein [Dongiaceae bacterium]
MTQADETTRPDDREDADDGPMVVADPAEVEALTRQMLEGLGLAVTVTVKDAGETLEVDVDGADRDLLIDHKGEALDALQYLANRIIYRGRTGKKIHFDSGGYRRGREDEIVESARRAAGAVKERGREQMLNPLNPYERRLVHIALAEIDGIGTRSIGDGFLKRIAIFLKDDATRRHDR